MSTQQNNPGTPAEPATQLPDAAPSQEGTPATANPPAPQTFSGTWFQEDDPQTLIQWSLQPAQAPGPPSPSDPGSSSPTYKAHVRIYQLIFDTVFPSPPQRGSVVPFSVADPAVGTAPFLQGSFALSQSPLGLAVMNLRFPGFQAQNLTLYSPLSAGPAAGDTGSLSSPAATADGEDTKA
jgi:hypothetical protein